MRILITGGQGFVGGRLAAYLQKIGHRITLGTRDVLKFPNSIPGVEVVHIGWGESNALLELTKGVDLVIHAAGMSSKDCEANPVAAFNFHGMETARLIDAAINSKVDKFIYFSTAHVYANPLTGVITEQSCPQNNHPYASSHLAGENSVLRAINGGQIDGFVIRLSNAFGIPAHDGVNCWNLVANDLCRQAATLGKLVLQTSGLQKRDFIPLSEVCRATNHLMGSRVRTQKKISLFNLGSGFSLSIIQLAEIIQMRSYMVYGMKPELCLGDSETKLNGDSLIYMTKALESTNFKMDGLALVQEIDELLRYCRQNIARLPQSNFC